MKVLDSIFLLSSRIRQGLVRRRKQAWSGVSVLIMRDDHAGAPTSFRINYYVLFFLSLLLVSIPAMGISLVVRQFMQKSDQYRQMMQRKSLLNSLQIIAQEKGEIMEMVNDQIVSFEKINAGDASVDLHDFQKIKITNSIQEQEHTVDAIGQNLIKIRNLRNRADILLSDGAYFSLNMIWNRVSIHHIMPRGRPLLPGIGNISSGFGPRPNPFGGVSGETHTGMDFAAAPGAPVIATAPGVVIRAVIVDRPGYGLHAMIHHGLGYTTLYAHCQKLLVVPGQRIERGQIIAELGRTGRVTGPHVHYEVKLGSDPATDPMQYVKFR